MRNSCLGLCAAILVLAGCENGTSKIGPQVEERTASEVTGCRFIGTVRGIPKVFGPLKSLGQEDAERVAKRRAQEAGANVVVFDPLDPEAEVFQVSGRAYIC